MYYFEIRKRRSHLYWPLRKENHILRIIMSSNHNILIRMSFTSSRASLVAQLVKNQPEMWEAWLRSLGWEDPLEDEMATHYSILVWRIPGTEEPGRLQSMGSQRVGHD